MNADQGGSVRIGGRAKRSGALARGVLDIAGMEIELSGMVGRKVDLRTPAELSRYHERRGANSDIVH
jgi:predicted nucleotidyltransferase